MKVELLIYERGDSESDLRLKDLVNLTREMEIPYVGEKVNFIIRAIDNPEELFAIAKAGLSDSRQWSCIVISDQLLDQDKSGTVPVASKVALKLRQLIKHSTSACGVIALTKSVISHVQDIDANVVAESDNLNALRLEVEKIVIRLWYKNPPHNLLSNNPQSLYSIEIVEVSNQQQLQECFELRGRTYETLGYIPESKGTSIEMDGYDPVSKHYLAIDKANNNRVAGTMRLVIPGSDMIANPQNSNSQQVANWCSNIANKITDRCCRDALKKNLPLALPVLGAFKYFKMEDRTLGYDVSVRPRNICEMSRVIVSPEFRGMGVSRLLVNHAIVAANKIKRKYLWLECATHHIGMYGKFGFLVKEYEGKQFYERAQRLDTWAVAMYLDIQKKVQQPVMHQNSTCYHMQVTIREQQQCALLFQFSDVNNTDIEQIFDHPLPQINQSQVNGCVSESSLKALLSASIKSQDIATFFKCLKIIDEYVPVEKLLLCRRNGRLMALLPKDIHIDQQLVMGSRLKHLLR